MRRSMPTLLCFGLGYSAEHFVAAYGDGFERIVGTARSAERATVLSEHRPAGSRRWCSTARSRRRTCAAITMRRRCWSRCRRRTASIPCCGLQRRDGAAPHLRSIVYLSTVGVYGDHAGAWVDEDDAAASGNRARPRALAASAPGKRSANARASRSPSCGWPEFTDRGGTRSSARARRARRIDKPGQVFNRIHVADIAQAIDAAIAPRAAGVFNVADDEPSPPGDPIVFAAHLLASRRRRKFLSRRRRKRCRRWR